MAKSGDGEAGAMTAKMAKAKIMANPWRRQKDGGKSQPMARRQLAKETGENSVAQWRGGDQRNGENNGEKAMA
jgi:hypothetical protein